MLALHAASLTYGRYHEVLPEVAEALHGALGVARGRGILHAHEAQVWAVAASPNGLSFASGDDAGTVRLWDAVTMRETSTLVSHNGGVSALAFSPDGRHLAASYADSLAILWPLSGATDTIVLRNHRGGVLSLAYDFTGSSLLTGGADGTARLWNPQSGNPISQFGAEASTVNGVAFAGWGLYVVTAVGSEARVWRRYTRDPGDAEPRCSFVEGLGTIVAVAPIGAAGTEVATAGQDGTTRVWSVDTCQAVRKLEGHSNTIFSLALTRDGRYLATASGDGTVKVWNPQNGTELFDLLGHSRPVYSAAFSPDGRRLYTGSQDSTVRVWDAAAVANEIDVQQPDDVSDEVRGLTFNPKRLMLAAVNSSRGTVLVSDLRRPRRSYTRDFDGDYLYAAAFSPDGARLAIGGDGGVRLLDAETGNLSVQLEPKVLEREKVGSIRALAFSPDGSRLAVGGVTGKVLVWTPPENSTVPLSGHEARVYALAFSPTNADILVSGGDDGRALRWDLGHPLTAPDTLEHYENGRVMSVAFSRNGRLLATAGDHGFINLYHTIPPQSVIAVGRVTSTIWSLAFSPDNKWLASAGFDGIARVWDVDSAKEVLRLRPFRRKAYSVAFSADTQLVASSGEGAIHISTVNPRTLLLSAWSRVNRPLSAHECRTFGTQEGERCPRALEVVAEGRRLAREGERDLAAARFKEAARLDATFPEGIADSLANAWTVEMRVAEDSRC